MNELGEKERELERLKLDDEIAAQKSSIAQRRALEREAKQKYGKDWKKILGYIRPRVNTDERTQDLYAMDLGGLRDMSRLGPPRRR